MIRLISYVLFSDLAGSCLVTSLLTHMETTNSLVVVLHMFRTKYKSYSKKKSLKPLLYCCRLSFVGLRTFYLRCYTCKQNGHFYHNETGRLMTPCGHSRLACTVCGDEVGMDDLTRRGYDGRPALAGRVRLHATNA